MKVRVVNSLVDPEALHVVEAARAVGALPTRRRRWCLRKGDVRNRLLDATAGKHHTFAKTTRVYPSVKDESIIRFTHTFTPVYQANVTATRGGVRCRHNERSSTHSRMLHC